MRKLAFLLILSLVFIACEQGDKRYTQSSAEIDTYNDLIANYEAADWAAYTAKFADTAKLYFNSDEEFMTPAQAVESHKESITALSSYGFVPDKGDAEMVTTDKGETWVNFWGLWRGTIASNGTEVDIPVHLTAQFVDGKVVKEYGYWDNAPMQAAIEEAQAAAEASEEESDEAEEGSEE